MPINSQKPKTMRDAFIESIYERMCADERIFFLSADMGAPALDKLRQDFEDRFINVGIAEQNLVNIATGLALEGFTVYAYAIASFISMRAYEQIRTNLALSAQQREINVNLIAVGCGVSYDMSGPSHHCAEDISIIRTLPNVILFSPSDWVMAQKFTDFSINVRQPKYIRLDGKPLEQIYDHDYQFEWEKGFCELVEGDELCIVSTGYMTHKALGISNELKSNSQIGVVDAFMLKPVDSTALSDVLKKYKYVITLEDAFVNKGGLDSLISNIIRSANINIKLKNLGLADKYLFDFGNRETLYQTGHCDQSSIMETVKQMLGR